ncbi:MAG: GAF domain-containing protein [Planctomycetota bacterium]
MDSLSETIHQLIEKSPGAVPFQGILDRVITIANGQGGTLHVVRGGALHLAAWTASIPEPVLNAIRNVPIGKGMAGVAAERREPVTTCDLQTDNAGGVARPNAKKTGFRGSICIPMISADGRLAGTLGIGCSESREFTETEVQQLLAVGVLIADAIVTLGETAQDKSAQ